MTDFTPASRPHENIDGEPLLDSFLREAIPEIKLALGDLIDRDNSRAIPDKYVKMLPLTTLVVTLRPDAAQAIADMAADLEEDLTDSVMRHGSLYDRDYKVRLKEAGSRGAPLFRVSTQPAGQPEPPPIVAAPPPPPPPPPPRAPDPEPTMAAPRHEHAAASPPPSVPAWVAPGPPPSVDPDATRVEGIPSAPAPAPKPRSNFPAGRYELRVEDEDGTERERLPIPGATVSVGRHTDDPALRSDIQLTGAPNVSRRQLALVWEERDGKPGFLVYNLGLNDIHVGSREVSGANTGKGEMKLDGLDAHSIWLTPGDALRIGGHGPVVRILEKGADADAEVPEIAEDPDKTQFG
ncbi:FHA domain-containing protein [Longimicrobium sp.]|jgi:pSer/pThr/pTyr-binding forkhead associated (FHA) protein|uniref:FHA domain-containing protein n=1 Tax=Longimicrobium sp. TaxID=2029185 RepID=UPI002EDAEDF4